MTTRVRFAPSPTGYLHIGSARTALFNYLFAKHVGGKFLLRIEDTDIERSTDESTRSILEGLQWLELQHDEEIVYQSNNAPKHRAVALKLLNEGKAYRDFTPREERSGADVKAAIQERAREQKDMRDNPFRDLPKEESDRKADAGEPFAIRLKVGASGKTIFDDAVYGFQERDYSEIEDLVLLRSDGHPLYNLAVVCDDIEMRITHVIRGQDHLTNTHKQVLIYEALNAEKPTFAHLPLILAPNKGKLSKRKHGEVVSMTTYRDNGFVAAAFRNFLVLLGWSAGEEKEIYTMDELVSKFSLDHIHKNNAVFNFDANDPRHWTDDKALWMNAEYIRTMPLEDLIPLVKAELKSAKLWRDEYEDDDKIHFEKTVDLIRERFFTLKDFSSQGRAFFSEDFDFDEAAIAKNLKKFSELQTWLPELAETLETVEDFTHDTLETVIKQFAEEKGGKFGVIMNGARTLLTGLAVGPSMLAVFETLGKEKTIRRLKSQIAWSQ
ncbi:MAG: Glutamyl-tRNA synthetase [uncultured Pyrinomonadaceae bacterium]|uniref:Glutamate--tRNA ligase n=1 Tax=uncultured Pyrinomonadaceae bacterium TaxID=2283094 RepID=A0A6J4NC88_9BACT|nr:MAG: Glutamyl-tRNA synthetase [uncultured Pyrinomonadaceae bacterium]